MSYLLITNGVWRNRDAGRVCHAFSEGGGSLKSLPFFAKRPHLFVRVRAARWRIFRDDGSGGFAAGHEEDGLLSRRVAPRAALMVICSWTSTYSERASMRKAAFFQMPNLTRDLSHATQRRLPVSSRGSMLVIRNLTPKKSLTSPLVREF